MYQVSLSKMQQEGYHFWTSFPLDISFVPSTYPFPQVRQQDVRSSAEMWAFDFPWDLMQIRSDMASTAPKA